MSAVLTTDWTMTKGPGQSLGRGLGGAAPRLHGPYICGKYTWDIQKYTGISLRSFGCFGDPLQQSWYLSKLLNGIPLNYCASSKLLQNNRHTQYCNISLHPTARYPATGLQDIHPHYFKIYIHNSSRYLSTILRDIPPHHCGTSTLL